MNTRTNIKEIIITQTSKPVTTTVCNLMCNCSCNQLMSNRPGCNQLMSDTALSYNLISYQLCGLVTKSLANDVGSALGKVKPT